MSNPSIPDHATLKRWKAEWRTIMDRASVIESNKLTIHTLFSYLEPSEQVWMALDTMSKVATELFSQRFREGVIEPNLPLYLSNDPSTQLEEHWTKDAEIVSDWVQESASRLEEKYDEERIPSTIKEAAFTIATAAIDSATELQTIWEVTDPNSMLSKAAERLEPQNTADRTLQAYGSGYPMLIFEVIHPDQDGLNVVHRPVIILTDHDERSSRGPNVGMREYDE
ncbi:hypothetical protein TREMEDRAFT_65219 [Tremella mesenterica DSM 1558]|uniref:uncharacterized protein n=1 Tax=Tremella mesenterica (strain ATCC 24925 / CBS 8224 / DSM 1558 / NBRC 9311 / NRRL Y-6157 / RJB 2259-6 / UBC 559-6) TaxID=578456 RepID=UPI00032C7C83|nr:uncharacterized protein TREMEDRAFT_65219 [Tremella mesenterica DSM 1558]EIW66814.1 hypothetical protein TREMEDRAFT_65219 [Tremella mesenterica DSM 1558]